MQITNKKNCAVIVPSSMNNLIKLGNRGRWKERKERCGIFRRDDG